MKQRRKTQKGKQTRKNTEEKTEKRNGEGRCSIPPEAVYKTF